MPVSEDHKQAMAVGRREGRIVRAYLESLEIKGKRGRKRTPESVRNQLARLTDASIQNEPDPVRRLEKEQERVDLETELAAMMKPGTSHADLEKRFVDICASYSERTGISYDAFRKVGVPAKVLKEAGVRR